MKKLLLLPLALFAAFSCGTLNTTSYDTKLVSVECPENAKDQFGETKISNLQEDGVKKYYYQDNYIDIVWYFDKQAMNFTIKNKTSHSIKLPWDDMAFVAHSGESMRVIHGGVKYAEKNAEQTPSIVAKNSTLTDLLVTADAIQYYNYGSYKYSGWSVANLLPQYKSQEDANANFKPLNVKIVFPIILEGVTNEYIFDFTIDNPVVSKYIEVVKD